MLNQRDCLTRKLKNHFQLWSLPLTLMLLTQMKAIAQVEIVPDTTLPNNSVVTPKDGIMEITEGSAAGDNLFHSFEQFSVLNGQTAYFDHALTIENIISRVTGDAISEIDGLIQANGTANLFLINPNGIVFGENAALDIGGSFIGTTANSLKFADDSEFSATNPESPLLTVNIPVGLQFGGDHGDIIVKGTGHSAFFDFDTFTIDRFERNLGLAVESGNTLALVGGDILLEGGNLTAEAGNIELGSVAEAGTVGLAADELGFTFDYGELSGGVINLADQASIDVSGNGSGNIQLQGDSLNLTDGSAIFAETEGDGTGGLTVIKTNQVNILGNDPDEIIPSSIWSDVYLDATGDGGSVQIDTENLLLKDGGQVNVNTFSLGDAGNLTVKANEIKVIGESPIYGDFISSLSAQADIFLTGTGGNISLETDSLFVSDGAQINASTFGDGEAGNIAIVADQVELSGGSELGVSGIFVSAEDYSTGNGGNLDLDANNLLVKNGAQIVAATSGEGDAGNLNITAQNIELSGDSELASSGIFVSTESYSTGNGGNLNLEADNLLVENGAQIVANTFGEGDAGSMTIEASLIELTGTSEENAASGVFSAVEPDALGQGGNIAITTEQLQVSDGALLNAVTYSEGNGGNIAITTEQLQVSQGGQIAVTTFASGDGGTLNIAANNVQLDGFSEVAASGLFSSALDGDGNSGDIILKSDRLSITDGATIDVGNFPSSNSDFEAGTGKAGSINLDVAILELDSSDADNFSSITASANTQAGGNISLNIADDASLRNGSQITAETQGAGNGGNINFTADNLTLNSQGQISVNSTETGNAGNIAIAAKSFDLDQGKVTATATQAAGGNIDLETDSLFLENQSEISTSVLGGDGGGGDITINNTENTQAGGNISLNIADDASLRNGSQITAETQGAGNGGNINFTADNLTLNSQGQISVNSTETGNAGNIAIAAKSFDLDQGKVTATATQAAGGNIDLETDSLFLENQSEISTSVLGGDGGGGDITINNTDFIIGKNKSKIKADAVFGDGGNIQINTTALFFDGSSEITASSEFGVDGVVEINNIESAKKLSTLQLVNNVQPPQAIVTSSCPVTKNNTFAITGKGGMPNNPGQYLRGEAVWQDLRIPAFSHVSDSAADHSTTATLVEAQTWQINQSGKVELTAKTSLSDQWGHNYQCSTALTD